MFARNLWLLCCFLTLGWPLPLLGQVDVVPVDAGEASGAQKGWSFFRGDRFDGKSSETKIASSWDEKGPPVLWKVKLGQGYSALVGKGERLFTQYQSLTGQFVVCLDAESGEKIWEYRYGWSYGPASLYPGPRSTPTLHGGAVYFATPSGEVGCLRAADGQTGETIWKAGESKISYSSAMPIEFKGQKLVVGYFRNTLNLFDMETGEEVCDYRVSDSYDEHSSWPIYREPHLWISGPFRAGCQLLELQQDDQTIRIRKRYQKREMSNDVASSILVEDCIYGFDIRDVQSKVHRPSRGQFTCMDFMTGEVRWQNGTLGRRSLKDNEHQTISSSDLIGQSDIGHASVIVADDKLLMLNDTGVLIVGSATPSKFEELGRWSILGGEILWTAPTLLNRRLYARNHTEAVCVYVGDVDELKVDHSKAKPSLRYAAELPQRKFVNLAAILLGVEPKYAMTAPRFHWLAKWYIVSIFGGWIVAPLIAVVVARLFPVISARTVFLTLVLVFGLLGTTFSGRFLDVYFFSWPIVLAVLFESLVCQLRGKDAIKPGRPLMARLSLVTFALVCLLYFWLCRRLSLAFQWTFLMGFPVALPFLWMVKARVQAAKDFSWGQWLLSAIAFSVFYCTGAAVIMFTYWI